MSFKKFNDQELKAKYNVEKLNRKRKKIVQLVETAAENNQNEMVFSDSSNGFDLLALIPDFEEP